VRYVVGSGTETGVNEMPNVMTHAEAEYAALFQDVQEKRVKFYSGVIDGVEYITARKKMEKALDAWESERAAQ